MYCFIVTDKLTAIKFKSCLNFRFFSADKGNHS